jgi:hypothetical protein
MPRVLANSRKLEAHGVQAHRVVRLGEAALGDRRGRDGGGRAGADAEPAAEAPADALRREVAAMRAAGVDLTVVLLQGSRRRRSSLRKDVEGIDMIVVGMPVGSSARGSAHRRRASAGRG